jgi:cytochrome c oxidase subunit III
MAQASRTLAPSPRAISPLLFGTIVFLASETLFFGGLFAAYYTLRSETSSWPPAGVALDVPLAALGTALLVTSSFTLQAGIARARQGRRVALRGWVLVSIALGLVFLGIQAWDWWRLWREGITVSSHAYGTMFYSMTGLHGLHVLAGIALMFVILGRLAQGAYGDGRLEGAEAIAYYWHFVDIVWIGLFATIFLLQ